MTIICRADQKQIQGYLARMPNDCLGKLITFFKTSESLTLFPLISKRIYDCFKEKLQEIVIDQSNDQLLISIGNKKFPNLKKIEFSMFGEAVDLGLAKILELNLVFLSCVNAKSIYFFPKTLKHLELHNSKLTDEHLQELPSALVSLKIYNNPLITNAGLKPLQALSNLLILDLSYCTKISDEGCLNLPPTLLSIQFTGCSLIKGLNFQSFYNLEELNLYGCEVSDFSLQNLSTTLKTLTLDSRNTNACFKFLPRNLLSLTFFNMTDDEFEKLPHLESLYITSNKNISGIGLAHLTTLKKLHFSSCENITDESLQYFSSTLIDLKFHRCCITDTALNNLPQNVVHLSLNYLYITDIGLSYLKNMPLQSLTIEGCDVTDRGLSYIQMTSLTALKLFICPEISPNLRKEWTEHDLKNNFISIDFRLINNYSKKEILER